jgi:hypothetical protein
MKYVKCIAVLLIGIFFISSILPNVVATSDGKTLLDRIIIGLLKYSYSEGPIASLIFNDYNTPWKVFRFAQQNSWIANPNVINITYLDEINITIGLLDPIKGGYQLGEEIFSSSEVRTARDFYFKIDSSSGVPEGAFTARFDPPSLGSGFKGEVKTKLTITSNIPKDADVPGEFLLRVNITGYTTYGNLFKVFFLRGVLFYKWAYELSGKRVEEGADYVDIVVKLKRFHLAEINPPKNFEIGPDELKSIPIEIKNLGSHADTFNFRINTTDVEDGLIVSPPPPITLNPNEVGYTSISVATTRRFQDPGTLHPISIEAYSIYEPEKVFGNTVPILIKGVYVSEVNWIYSAFFGIIIILVLAFISYRRKKKSEKICKKPEKPWEIPEEKEYLEGLKKKDKKEYGKVLKMMEEEYESALLWYKSYLKVMTLKEKQEKQKTVSKEKKLSFVTDIFKKLKVKKEAKKPIVPDEEKAQTKIEEMPGKNERIDAEFTAEQKKQEAILRIKREQEKQKRKFSG